MSSRNKQGGIHTFLPGVLWFLLSSPEFVPLLPRIQGELLGT